MTSAQSERMIATTGDGSHGTRCSVVVTVQGHARELPRVLSALARQTLPPDEYEVIVCADAGRGDIAQHVERWSAESGVVTRCVRQPGPGGGPVALRNLGWRATRGQVVAFTDVNAIPNPDWLRQGLIALADDAADAAAGRVVVPAPDESVSRERDRAYLEESGFVTVNCFCRRSVLTSIGGFDQRFHTERGGDNDLFFRLISRGFDVVQATDAVVEYPVDPVPRSASLREQRKQASDALLYKKHPDLSAQVIRRDRPYLHYTILTAVSVMVAGAVASSAVVTELGLGAWCVLTGVVIARRRLEMQSTPSRVAQVMATSVAIPFLSVYWRVRGGIAHRVAFW